MSVFLPRDPALAGTVVLVLVLVLAGGFLLRGVGSRATARACAWSLAVVSVLAVERLGAAERPGFRLLAVCGALLYSMKAVVTVESRLAGEPQPGPWAWLLFAVGWFGMRPAAFAAQPRRGARAGPLALRGLALLALGVGLVLLARGTWLYLGNPWAASLALLPGLSLMLHFGAFHLLAAGWRAAGFACHPLFRAPLRSQSLGEFWSRRWNLAFSEMTSLAVFRPLVRRTGPRTATLAAFLFSGVLHELAISVPVKAGFGLPLGYFTLHGLLVLGERGRQRTRHRTPRSAAGGRLWTVLWLVAPLPILFHPPFLRGVLWPLIGADGG